MAHRLPGGSSTSIAGVHKNHGQVTRDRRFRTPGNPPLNDSILSQTSYEDSMDENIDTSSRFQVLSAPSSNITSNVATPHPTEPMQKSASIEELTVAIQNANRRSHVLSACMSKERVSFRPMGRGKDGTFHYAIYLEECQGFCWNTNLQKFNSRIMPEVGGGFFPFCNTNYDVFSEDESYEEGSY